MRTVKVRMTRTLKQQTTTRRLTTTTLTATTARRHDMTHRVNMT
jgi:hypothetical protein